jgi:hypothetical protein
MYCVGGGFPFPEKITGLMKHKCGRCGEIIGLRLKWIDGQVEVFESGDFMKMQMTDWAHAIARKEAQNDQR